MPKVVQLFLQNLDRPLQSAGMTIGQEFVVLYFRYFQENRTVGEKKENEERKGKLRHSRS